MEVRNEGETESTGSHPERDRSQTAGSFQRLLRWSWRVLVLVALALVGHWAWQGYRAQLNAPAAQELATRQQVRDLESALARQTAELKLLRERLAEQAQAQEALQRGQDAQQALELANAQRSVPNGDLLPVLEAEALLRLAAQHLWVSRSVHQALPLLVRADGLLALRDDPALAAARAALVADITALKLVAMPDVEGVYLRLDALQDVMGALLLVPQPVPESQAAPAAAAEGGFWERLRGNAVAALRRFSAEHLRVRTLDQAPPGMLSAAAEARLRQYLRLLLSQAQLALLERQPGIYGIALTKTATLLEAHFGADPRVAATVAELKALRELDIAPVLPDLATAREQLRSHVARQASGSEAPGP